MIKEIKFTDKALKQINALLSKKDKGLFFKPLFEKVSTDAERGNHESNRNPYQTFAGLRRVSLKLLINVPA